jgi:hypothetical protein
MIVNHSLGKLCKKQFEVLFKHFPGVTITTELLMGLGSPWVRYEPRISEARRDSGHSSTSVSESVCNCILMEQKHSPALSDDLDSIISNSSKKEIAVKASLFKTQKTFQRVTPDVSVRPTSDISPVN